ncbi:MAG: ABC transporter ATP-binding protein [bacterium]|nr:ABC transporter ATP-binding protein [bacterium]
MKARNLAYCGIFGTLALVLPMVFHALGLAGVTFLPMYWPLITLAFLVPIPCAVFMAAFIPCVSMCLTGMPLPPMTPVMSLELAVQAGLLGIIRACAGRTRPMGWGKTFVALAVVLVFGRGLHTVLVWLLVRLFPNLQGVPHLALTWMAFLIGWPGVALMLLFTPVFIGSVTRQDGVCEVRFLKALRRLHLPEGVVLLSAQVLRWFEALSRDAEMLARALELRRGGRGGRTQGEGDNGPVMRMRDVEVLYPGASEPALKIRSLDVQAGEKIALTGRNGSGKTTLLSILAGFVSYTGEVAVFGQEPKGRVLKNVRRRLGVLFENPDDQFLFPTVREDVGHALEGRGLSREEIDRRVDELLTSLGLPTGNRPVASLSRGQRQRAALAGILAAEPDLLLLDEPTAALDDAEKMRLAEVLRALPSTMLVATHDKAFAAALCSRTLDLLY